MKEDNKDKLIPMWISDDDAIEFPENKENEVEEDEIENIEEEQEEPEFESEIKETDEEEEESEEGTEVEDDNPLTTFYNYFKEKGIITTDDDYVFDGTEESFLEVQQKTAEKLAQQEIDKIMENLPPAYQTALNYAKKGSIVEDEDFQVITGLANVENVDIKDESIQEEVMRTYLKLTTIFNDKKIDALIENAKESATLAEESKEYLDSLVQYRDRKKDSYEQRLSDLRRAEQEKAEEFELQISNVVDALPKVRKQKVNDILNKKYRTKDGEIVTAFDMKMQEYLSKPELIVELAQFFLGEGTSPKQNKDTKSKTSQARTLQELLRKNKNTETQGKFGNGKTNNEKKAFDVKKANLIFTD